MLLSAAAFAQCTFTVSPSPAFVDSTAQNLVIQVTASAQTCAWTAASSGFATTTSTGTGNGSATYAIAQNTTGNARTVSLTVAGNTVSLQQNGTASTFSDVFPGDFYFDGANIMRQFLITAGCATQPTLRYCPNDNVTRGQMAIFVVRSVLGGGSTVDNFLYSTTPYFTDVPSTHPFFKWIQKMRDLGVTAGCSATQYCPDANVTRGQMAVFIVRARLGASTAFTYNPSPFFGDVPGNYPYFQWIQKLKEIGITAGCGSGNYCPDALVTRGQMAIFLVRAGFNQLLSASAPLITSAQPNSAAPGASVGVMLTGINTNFVPGTTTVLPVAGITVGTVTVTDATHLTVQLTVASNTPLGPRSLTAKTNAEEATLPNGFIIGAGDPVPTITDFNPKTGPIGTAVTLTGTGLVSSSGTPADVRMPKLGGGIVSAPLTAAAATSLSFVIPSTAATGTITVAASSGSVTSASQFTVVPSNTFTITAAPSAANLIAGQTATFTITLASSNGFTNLAQLSVAGVPAGVTATFKPQQITAGQQSVLTLTAPSSQAATSANLVITAASTVDGLPLSLSANTILNITPITTSFVGRTVVDDGKQTTLVGVTVTMLGKDGGGNNTGCTGSTISDGSGNFALTNLPNSCVGPQLVGFNGNTTTAPPGKYAGVDLVFTLTSGQVTASPVLIHLPRIDNVETFLVKQNSVTDQTYAYASIPGLSVTVYAGTTMTNADGTQPDPFPLAAIEVPVDRLPDQMPVNNSMVAPFIVAFQPANATASKAIAVSFPNTLNIPPGTNMPLMTLDPTRGRMVPYGTGTVSNDGTTIIPDVDPSTGALNHRFGIVHFDWHGPSNPPNPNNPSPDPCGPNSGDPVDLSSGIEVITNPDFIFRSGRGNLVFVRNYRTLSTNIGPFGIGTNHNYGYRLNSTTPQNAATINLIMPDGNQLPFTRQQNGTLVNTTIPSLNGAVMTTNPDGTSSIRWKDGRIFKFVPGNFQTGSVLVEMDDPSGNATVLIRNPNNPVEILTISDPAGRKLTLAYDGANRISSLTDPIGRTVQYTYTADNHLASFTNPTGGVTTYEYNSPQRFLTKITDPRGTVIIQNTYDANGRVISQTQADGGQVGYAYTTVNSLVPTSPVTATVLTDPLGRTTTYRFNTQGFLVNITDPTGAVRTFVREAGTNRLLGVQGTGVCNACGVTKDGDVSFTYDSAGNILTITNALGNTTSFTYEPVFNKLATSTDALGNTTTYSYDGNGNLLSTTDPNNHVTKLAYNNFGQITKFTDALNQSVALVYDSVGNLLSMTDPKGVKTSFVYDGASRAVQLQDNIGNVMTYQYDNQDRLVKQVLPGGQTMQTTFDAIGNATKFIDPNAHAWLLTYDAMGRVISRTDPAGKTETYGYDSMGNLVTFTDRRGQVQTYTYDPLNHLITESYTDGRTVKRSYDANGRLSLAQDSSAGTFKYTYDLFGKLVQQVSPFGVLNYTRDKLGRVSARQVVGQPAVSYTYDPKGNVTSVSTQQPAASVSMTYDARDFVASITRSNGVATQLTFDPGAQLASIIHAKGNTVLNTQTYTYDSRGDRASITTDISQPLATQSATGNQFDQANRMVAFGNRTYTNDANGNRVTETGPEGTTTYVWDSRNALQAILQPGGINTSFLYDPNGNLIQRRVTTANSDTLDHFLVDDHTNIAYQERVDGDRFTMLSGRSLNQEFATIAASGPIVFGLTDGLNSVVGVSGSGGTLDGKVDYEAYGQPTATGTAYPFQYGGQLPATGTIYYGRARFYDSMTGRFLSEDPAGILGGYNTLRYANGNPINLYDPTGLDGWYPDWAPHGGGIQVGGSADAGAVFGAGGSGSLGGGYFSSGGFGGYSSSGAYVGGPGAGVNWEGQRGGLDTNGEGGWSVGASAGAGGSVFLTNAKCAKQLGGPFHTFNFQIGLGIGIGFSVSWDDSGTWIGSFAPPFAGGTVGVGASYYTTTSHTTR